MAWKEKLNIVSHVSPRHGHDLLVENGSDKDVVAPGPKEHRRFWFAGWKGTLYLGSATSFAVLILNLVIVSWATFRNSDDRQSVLYRGSCERVKAFSILFHLLINILSTLLLASSNFAMVCKFQNSLLPRPDPRCLTFASNASAPQPEMMWTAPTREMNGFKSGHRAYTICSEFPGCA